jgi:hypothetical protein
MKTRVNDAKELDQGRDFLFGLVYACLLVLPAAVPVNAQQINGTPGSPSATTTIDGRQVPAPDPKFGGVIKENAAQSKPWWAPRVVPPKGAPNVLLIMTDFYISGDNGSSAEGQLIGTPNEVAMFNGVQVPVEDQLKYFYDVWGTDRTYNHMAVGWTWAFDTPFTWTKQIASHFGGTRQGTFRGISSCSRI